MWPTIQHEKLFTQNITFIFETYPITKLKEKKVGDHGILCPPRLKKWGDTSTVSPTKLRPWNYPSVEIDTSFFSILTVLGRQLPPVSAPSPPAKAIFPTLFQNRWTKRRYKIWPQTRDEHGSGLDQDWSQFWPNQDWIGLQFFQNWPIGTGSDRENFCCCNVIILKISKILVVIRYHRLAKWQCIFCHQMQKRCWTILQFELYPPLFTYKGWVLVAKWT